MGIGSFGINAMTAMMQISRNNPSHRNSNYGSTFGNKNMMHHTTPVPPQPTQLLPDDVFVGVCDMDVSEPYPPVGCSPETNEIKFRKGYVKPEET